MLIKHTQYIYDSGLKFYELFQSLGVKFRLMLRKSIATLLISACLVGCQTSNETPADCDVIYETQASLVLSARDAKNRGDEVAFRQYIDQAAQLGADALSFGC